MAENQSHEPAGESKPPGMLDFLWKKEKDPVEPNLEKEDSESVLKTEEREKIQSQEEYMRPVNERDEEVKPAPGVLDFLWKKKEDPVKNDDDESMLNREEEHMNRSREEEAEHGKKEKEDELLVSEMEKVRVSDYPDSEVEQPKGEGGKKHHSLLQKLNGSDSASSSSSDEEDAKSGVLKKKKKKGLKEEIAMPGGDKLPHIAYGSKEEETPFSTEKKPYNSVSREEAQNSGKTETFSEEISPPYGASNKEIDKPYHDPSSAAAYKLEDQTVPTHVGTESVPFESKDKKGFMEKLKGEIPGGIEHEKLKASEEETAVVSPSAHDGAKKGMFEKFKDRIPNKIREKIPGHHHKPSETEQHGS